MLQNYLRALLARFVNKKDVEFISAQCTPSSNRIILDIPSVGTTHKYTAPCNGYLSIGAESIDGLNSVMSWGKLESTITATMTTNGGHSGVFIPLQKGDTQSYKSNSKFRFVHFVKMTGGG